MEDAMRLAPIPALALLVAGVPAAALDGSPTPAARPEAAPVVASLRPNARPGPVAAAPAPAAVQASTEDGAFEAWVEGFRGRALAQGIRAEVFDAAFAGVRLDPEIVRRDRNQSEFTKTIWQYLETAVSESRIRGGRAALAEHSATFEAIERTYGVEKEVVAAIWGLESAYGAHRGTEPVIGSLATLAHDGRRGAFFEEQLVAALRILQAGDTAPADMTGSWAGAMGHTQFIPTSFLAYAVDGTGDGRRDIWGDDPTDALASTAAYLAGFGWTTGQPWGVEVTLPEGFDYASADRAVTRLPSEWAATGVRGADGKAVPDHGTASVLLPAGAQGAAFLVFDNFAVIERYNTADAYVIGVGHLADRLAGGGPIRSGWPEADRALTFAERQEMQRRLTGAGFDTQGVDGRIGPLTIAAIRGFQRSAKLVPDGYASLALLDRLR
jgi:membrane-bound lytic murein transglycosylase B